MATSEQTFPVHDLRPEVCPMTFVKAKIHLDSIPPGERLELILKPGEQLKNVPRSLKSEGHTIETVRQDDEGFHLVVRRGE